jgi:hypothetical protein
MRSTVLLLAVLSLAACDETHPTGPTVPLGREFVLAPGEVAAVENGALQIRFDAVMGDSRCPADALCVLGGDAIVRVTVLSSRESRPYDLHTGDLRPVSHNGLTIALVQLSPYPFSAAPIEPNDYRATLVVRR